MNPTHVLVLNGSPGSGKSTLADAISEMLREAEQPNAVIDVDELARLYPELPSSFKWANLAAVWPNYAAIDDLKVILPVLIDTEADLDALQRAAPAATFSMCELVASESTLKARVMQREPNDYWKSKLRKLVEAYRERDEQERFRDFQVSTESRSVGESAQEIVGILGWESPSA